MMRKTITDSLRTLERWGAKQSNLRLELGPPLLEKQIAELPEKMASAYPYPLAVPFKPEEFEIPRSYREFLTHHSFARIEYKDESKQWVIYEPFNIFSPEEMARGHSWSTGATLNNREIYTTFLVAFAAAGYTTEASRWCFYTDKDIQGKQEGELPILIESNDYECDLAKYVDTREWVEGAFKTPAAYAFDGWFSKLVSILTSKPFKPKRRDEIPNSFYAKGK